MTCYCCKIDKMPEEFPPGNNRCRPCHTKYQAERRARLAENYQPNMEGEKKCSTCQMNKPKTEFGIAKGVKDGFQSQCNRCRSISRKAYNTSGKGHIQNMVASAKRRNRIHKKGFEIDIDFVSQMWKDQNGRCCLSGVEFIVENETNHHVGSRDPRSPSIDRIDCTKGYVPGNVRLITTFINTAIGTWGPSVLTNIAISMATKHGYRVIPPCTPPTTELQSNFQYGTPQ